MSSPSNGVKEKSVVSKDGLKPFIMRIELLKTLFVLKTIVSLMDSNAWTRGGSSLQQQA